MGQRAQESVRRLIGQERKLVDSKNPSKSQKLKSFSAGIRPTSSMVCEAHVLGIIYELEPGIECHEMCET